MKKTRLKALLLPGFNGSAEQPMLLALAERLEAEGIDAIRRAPAPGRPSVDLASETTWLLNELKPLGSNVCVVGRSFGGRLALRAAHVHSMLCLGLLGFPLRPPKKRRPEDERLLNGVQVPTLIVQGSVDELGPMRVIQSTMKGNDNIALHVLKGAGHAFGRHEAEALDRMVQFVTSVRDAA